MKKKTSQKDETQKQEENQTEGTQQDKIPRNVNYYRHLLDANYINENDINWVLKLRDSKKYNTQKLLPVPFKVQEKFTESIKQNEKKLNSDLVNNNASNVEHLTRHRIGAQQSQGTVNFEISLRPNAKVQTLRELERAFSSIPYKDRGQHPIKYQKLKDELTKTKELRSQGKKLQYESNFDGRNNYPPYDLKYRDKNFNRIQHLKNTKLEIGQLKWENSLR